MTSASIFRRRLNAPAGAALMLGMPVLPEFAGSTGPARPAGGFGLTMEQVVGSGAGELIERYSATIVPDPLPDTGNRVPLARWIPFTDAQYAEGDFPMVDPRTLDGIAWSRAWDVKRKCEIGVPAALVYLSRLDEPEWCTVTSSGLAAGRTAGATARSALFELIERDAFFRTWYAGTSGPTVSLDDLVEADDDRIDAATRRYAQHVIDAGVEVTLVRLATPATGVSVVAACARSPRVGLAVGCAAKGTPALAVRSALIEAVQTYAWAAELNADTANDDGPGDGETDVDDGLRDHVAYHARPDARRESEFFDGGIAMSPAEFLAGDAGSLTAVVDSLDSAGWDVYFADVASSDVRRNGWHVIRALSPSAATLDVGPIHEAQHPGIRVRTPHPFP